MRTSKSFNPQSLISHLTNSTGCGNLRIKVLLPVSSFHPFLLPPPRVFSRNRRLLPSYAPRGATTSPVLSTLRILPVATGLYRDPGPTSSVSLSLYGKSRVLSSLQPLVVSLRSFLHSLPLFPTACSLFLQNTGGGVSRAPLDVQMRLLHPECIYGTCRHSNLQAGGTLCDLRVPISALCVALFLATRFVVEGLPPRSGRHCPPTAAASRTAYWMAAMPAYCASKSWRRLTISTSTPWSRATSMTSCTKFSAASSLPFSKGQLPASRWT